jgi:sulfite exporter TauE/SafE
MIAAGVLVIGMGVLMSGYVPTISWFKNSSTLGGFLSRGFNRLTRRQSTVNYFFIGLLLGFLPCGPVYTVLIASARAGMEASSTGAGFIDGMLLMFAFGVGTIPALFLVGKLTSLGWLVKREIIYKVGAALMIAVGVYFVYQGIRY